MPIHRIRNEIAALLLVCSASVAADYPLRPAPLGSVTVEGGFWGQRIDTNAQVTLPHNLRFMESSGRLANFDRAAGLDAPPHVGNADSDSDVFKVLEGAAHTLRLRPGMVDENEIARHVARVIAAQQDDGFLCTKFILANQDKRWDDLRHSHLLYSAGHLFEAGVAWRDATGRKDLLETSARYADLIDRRFGHGKIRDVPGHQQIELALVKLHRATGERRYLDLAGFFLDQRGHIHGGSYILRGLKPRWADYNQDRIPLAQAPEAVGHAVRGGYTYAAMTDIAAMSDHGGFRAALDRIWRDVVDRKLYITGGSATAQYYDEGFGDPYHLPNETAYCETCGNISTVLWSHRMALLHGDAEYFDILERSLYNGVLSGISLSGDRFFYTNRLASRGADERHPSWDPPCCQTNLVRTIPQVGSMAYSTGADIIHVNLFVAGTASLKIGTDEARLKVETDYPHDGKVRITIGETTDKPFTIALRIPGWAREKPVPGDLYQFATPDGAVPVVRVAGRTLNPDEARPDRGYVRLKEAWKTGDVIELDLPMPIRRVVANECVVANRGRVAIQRGPLVYCVESIDHGGMRTDALVLHDRAKRPLRAEWRPDLLGGVTVITGDAGIAVENGWGEMPSYRSETLVAIPYYAWANRGRGYMDVWLARSFDPATPLPAATAATTAVASASGAAPQGNLTALNDDRWGPRADERSMPRFTWSADGNGERWVQYEWKQPRKLERSAVFWAVDRRQQVYWGERIRGEDLVLPKSWRLFYQNGGEWLPVETEDRFTLRLDDPNEIRFKPVTTRAIRLVVEPAGSPCAIREWRMD